MNLRNTTLIAFVLLALSLSSCGSLRRAGKDLTMAVATPVMMLYGGGTDAMDDAMSTRAGIEGGAATEVLTGILLFPIHALKHGFYGLVHAVDFFLLPIYGAADLHPYGPEIEPLNYYTGTWFDDDGSSDDSGTDAESGESND